MEKFKLDFSDGLSQEWNFKFKIKLGTLLVLMLALFLTGAFGHAYFIKKTLTPNQKYIASVVSDYKVRRHFDGHAYGTFWQYCGVTLTADHVLAELVDEGEAFVGKRVNRSFGVIDAAHFGKWKCEEPREPIIGDEPVVGGMSGGIVISEDGTPLGPLVTQNSPTYFLPLKAQKHSADFVALHDYWDFVLEPNSD